MKNDRDIRRLMLYSCGAVVLFELLVAVLNTLVEGAYAGTGGLEGLQIRAMLDTARFLVQDVGLFLLPFWQIAVIRVAICKHRGQPLNNGLLTFGFTRFGPVLGLNLILGFLLMAVATTCLQAASLVFSLTPKGREAGLYLAELLAGAEDTATLLEMLPMDGLLEKLAPALVLSAVIGIPVVYLVWCRFRLANYLIMEDEKVRAFPAMIGSAMLTKGQLWNFLRLDLGLWKYYLALAFVAVLGYGDVLLELAGVQMNPQLLFYCAFALRSALRLCVAWGMQHRAELTYAGFYDTLKGQIKTPEE